MKRALVLASLLAASACGTRPAVTTDGGGCGSAADCTNGDVCIGGVCQPPTTQPDGGGICERDEDCPTGLQCVRSTGECVTPSDVDAGDPSLDAGSDADLCQSGATEPCGISKIGECRLGVRSCVGGDGGVFRFGDCVGAVLPQAEDCNGKDDDCDGDVDEGFAPASCGVGACRRTVNTWVSGVPQTCTPGMPATETCNGIDDDCDGTIDQGCACTPAATRPCYSGPAGTQGIGRCVAGTQTCSTAGQWGACSGEVLPAAETCNGQDDDCDAAVDDGLGTVSCGVGACARTVQACVGGVAQTCTPGTPGTETCNGLDDDCDNTVDNGLGNLTCGVGDCVRTVTACLAGMPQTCTPGAPGTEVCDGRDNDCGGSTDESFPQSGMSCATGLAGACGTGVSQCSGGMLGCQQTVTPAPEICANGIDENCNGIVDDGPTCCMNMADNDADGVNACNDCNDNDGSIKPGAPELCDGKDNDCDGLIDEGFDVDMDGFTTCGTKLGGGIDPARRDCNDTNAFVFPLKTVDCGNAATPTSPNNVDDNCNGYVDETCNCRNQDRDGDGVTECQGDCNDNDATVAPGVRVHRAGISDGGERWLNAA